MYLSAYLKRLGFGVQCLDMGLGHTPDMAESHIIGVSFTTPQRLYAYEIAEHCRGTHKLIAGGPHPTHMPGEVRTHGFDIVIRGYGEALLASVLGTRDSREFNWDFPPDRDALPLNEYHYEIDGRRATPIMTTRGCRYNCSFCAKMDWKSQIQKADRVVEEIFDIRDRYGISAFMIFDDVFIVDKERTQKITSATEKEDFLFRCFGRADLLDKENCDLLARMGTVEVGLGVESGSDTVLKKNRKGTSRKMNTEAVKNLKEVGIRTKAFLIVGLPGETKETIQETIDWIEEMSPEDIDATIFQPLPGSAIFNAPSKWGIEFEYDGIPQWYKGRPGEYSTSVRTDGLSSEEIVRWRDEIERRFKKKEFLR
jgi:radical SAM superfamily enzyme YgiQ (UPF0313 family)